MLSLFSLGTNVCHCLLVAQSVAENAKRMKHTQILVKYSLVHLAHESLLQTNFWKLVL